MQSNPDSSEFIDNPERVLAEYLASLADTGDDPFLTARFRQTAAALRRGLANDDGWNPAVAQVVDSLFEIGTVPQATEIVLFQGAALFGSHPYSTSLAPLLKGDRPHHETLGRALRNLMDNRANNRESDAVDERAAFDKHFEALLNARRKELFGHLRRTIARFQGTQIGIDWEQLMHDIGHWEDARYQVQRNWARDWWAADRNPLMGGTRGRKESFESEPAGDINDNKGGEK